MRKPLPFDALVLAAVVREAQPLVGAYLDRVRAVDESTLLLETKHGRLLVSCDPHAPRVFLTQASHKTAETSGFLRLVADRLDSGRIDAIEQIGFDRRLRIVAKGCELVADLIGTRANMTLLGQSGALGRLRRVAPPSGEVPASLEDALATNQGLSPVLKQELEAVGKEELISAVEAEEPVFYPGLGAYPMRLASVEANPMPMASLSQALEKHYESYLPRLRTDALVSTLRGQLLRAQKARQTTLRQIEDVLDTASRSRRLQMYGELILAYRPEGVSQLVTQDYDGNEIKIDLDRDLPPPENAEKYFKKAKRAKNAAGELAPKAEALKEELEAIASWLTRLEAEPAGVEREMRDAGVLREQTAPEKREVKHDGFRVRQAVVEGYDVFWGENATANDYVTTRLAKPNDFWLHVRGGHGAHVVLRTNGKPDRVSPQAMQQAAVIAAKNSNQKHAQHVPVTVTLAKYVRKPRKSAPGAVTFTNDKTLFVDP